MRLSKFSIFVPYQNDYLLYNTRTQALLLINKEIKDALEVLPKRDLFLEQGEKELRCSLHNNGIIVEDKIEENNLLENYFFQIKKSKNIATFEVVLLTTLKCNFACDYCFEEGSKDGKSLSGEDMYQVVLWLQDMLLKYGYEKIHITFYGGEPLLNKRAISFVSKKMHKWCMQHKIDYSFGLFTNGYLLMKKDIVKWIKFGLRRIQITIDGPSTVHNAKRKLHNGANTFDKIIENIENIIDENVKISVSGNYDEYNYREMPKLLDFFKERGLLHKLNNIGFTPLSPRFGRDKQGGIKIELCECLGCASEAQFTAAFYIRKEMLKRGVRIPSLVGYTACMLISEHAGIIIAPNGDLYKCPTMIGYKGFAIGNIYANVFNSNYDEFLNIDAWRKCDDTCPYVPLCNGGCRFLAYVKKGNLYEPYCNKSFIDKIISELIIMEYEK